MRKELEDLSLALKEAFDITTFIETGIFKAATTTWASLNFDRVISIELDEGYYNRAVGLQLPNTRLINGDSATELPKVVKRLKKPALFWLDAHTCKDRNTAVDKCPLLAELKAIRDTSLPHLILIDDARYFVERIHPEWPTMEEIKAALPEGYQVVIWQAAIIAVPMEAMRIVRRFVEPEKLEVIVLTSNAYLHCLPPFAYLFNKFWSIHQPVKVVRYEHRPRNLPTNFSNFAIGNQADYTWSSGLIKYLQHHNSELVLLMLEDYFLSEPVQVAIITQLYALMQNQPEIAKIDLTNDRLKVAFKPWPGDFPNLIQSDPNAPFLASLQAAIWRKDFLLRYLDPTENPWQFEKQATKRMAKEQPVILGCKTPPMTYINAIGGEGGNPGAWDNKKIPQWMVNELKGRGLI